MTIDMKVHANADEVLIAWRPRTWSDAWVGFQIERRNHKTRQTITLNNRIPPKPGQGPVEPTGISSALSPIRRCLWTDHSVEATDKVSYRVTAMKGKKNGGFALDPDAVSDWTPAAMISGEAGNGLSAFFNRGTLMSQIVSRFVNGDVTEDSLRKFKSDLENPGFPARRYLAGHARHEILSFLADADRRGSQLYAAIYEIDDHELVEALKPFGKGGISSSATVRRPSHGSHRSSRRRATKSIIAICPMPDARAPACTTNSWSKRAQKAKPHGCSPAARTGPRPAYAPSSTMC